VSRSSPPSRRPPPLTSVATGRGLRGVTLVALMLAIAGCARSRSSPRITTLPPDLVLVSRVGSDEVPTHAAGCALQTFDRMPPGVLRDLGSIELAGSVPAGADIFAAVDQKACESGADAIVVTQREQRNLADRTEYHVIAEAVLMHPAADNPSPSQASAQAAVAGNGSTDAPGSPPPPNEALMQPVGRDAASSDELGGAQPSSAMTESSIAATEAAPLTPLIAPLGPAVAAPTGAALAAQSPGPTASPTADVSTTPTTAATPAATTTPTSIATSSLEPTTTATPTATPTPTATVTVAATPIDTPIARTSSPETIQATATITPAATVGAATGSATATPVVSPTPSPDSKPSVLSPGVEPSIAPED
jgi:hypothetical protein